MIQPEDLCRHFNKRVFIKNSRFISSLFTFSPATPLFIGVSGGEEFLAICLLISFVLNQLAIEGKTSLRYREDDGT